ncbi:MAG: hypothetical protein F6J93_39095 [Oscillatoria sp. SIO1A7]|nr:hypothetical protein [Oscillatoria sp. SIO1A7]
MSIENYFQQIRVIIEEYPGVQSSEFVSQKRTEYEGFVRGNILFKDGSILHWREYVDVEYGIERDMYSYQYMDASKHLIFRYDNAEHHRERVIPSILHTKKLKLLVE